MNDTGRYCATLETPVLPVQDIHELIRLLAGLGAAGG
jgi:hypothetical protein